MRINRAPHVRWDGEEVAPPLNALKVRHDRRKVLSVGQKPFEPPSKPGKCCQDVGLDDEAGE
jgi:hypothetical protein